MAPSAVLKNQSASTGPGTDGRADSRVPLERQAADRKISLRMWAAVAVLLLIHASLLAYSATRHTSGLISLFLWCFEPNILAHGELITSDCAATAFGLGAGYLFWQWLKQPTWRRALAAGRALGLATLTKTAWTILFVLRPLLWFAWRSALGSKAADRRQSTESFRQPSVFQLAAILLLGMYLLTLGYGFGTAPPATTGTAAEAKVTLIEPPLESRLCDDCPDRLFHDKAADSDPFRS